MGAEWGEYEASMELFHQIIRAIPAGMLQTIPKGIPDLTFKVIPGMALLRITAEHVNHCSPGPRQSFPVSFQHCFWGDFWNDIVNYVLWDLLRDGHLE